MKLEDRERQNHLAAQWAGSKIRSRREASAFARAHGKSHTFLYEIMNSPDPSLSRLQALAEWLGLTVPEMIAEAHFAETDRLDRLRRPKELPEIALAVLKRARASKSVGSVKIVPELQRLQRLSTFNPVSALAELLALASEVPEDQLPYILSVSSHCYSTTLEWGRGLVCAELALELGEQQQNLLAQGTAQQSWAYLFAETGQLQASLSRIREARTSFIQSGSSHCLAHSFVDQCWILYKNKRFEEALVASQAVAPFSSLLADWTNMAFLTNMAYCRNKVGDVSGAREDCKNALRIAQINDSCFATSKIRWAHGIVEGTEGNVNVAEELILSASEKMLPLSPLDVLITHLEFAYFFLEKGYKRQCLSLLESLSIPEFNEMPSVGQALSDFTALAFMDRLSGNDVRNVTRRISAEYFKYQQTRLRAKEAP